MSDHVYTELTIDDIVKLFKQHAPCADPQAIAQVLQIVYQRSIIFRSATHWYYFNGHNWMRNEAAAVEPWLSPIKNIFVKILQETCDPIAAKVCKKLKLFSFRYRVAKLLSVYLHNSDIQFDQNRALFLYRNGVYDATNKIFRPSRPEDYCSTIIPCNYKEFTPDNPLILEIQAILGTIFPNPENLQTFERTICAIFRGDTDDGISEWWSGDGYNGKKTCVRILEVLFGKHLAHLPSNILTKPLSYEPSFGAPVSVGLELENCRVAIINNPDLDTINTTTLNSLAGWRTFYARDLFKTPTAIKPKCKLILISTALPENIEQYNSLPFDTTSLRHLRSQEDLAEALLWYFIQRHKQSFTPGTRTKSAKKRT